MDDSPIRSKTAPFSFENGLVWTGPHRNFIVMSVNFLMFISKLSSTHVSLAIFLVLAQSQFREVFTNNLFSL